MHPEVQAAILDFFRTRTMEPREVGPFEYHDKIPLKSGYAELGVRVVPPALGALRLVPLARRRADAVAT